MIRRVAYTGARHPSLPALAGSKNNPLAVREAREVILALIDTMALEQGPVAARQAFVAAAQSGRLPSDTLATLAKANAKPSSSRTVSERTLLRWQQAREAAALAPRPTPQQPVPVWLDDILAEYQVPTKPSLADAYAACARRGVVLPSLRTVQREVAQLGELARNRGRMGQRELRRLKAFRKRTFEDLLPLDVVSADGHRFQAEVAHLIHGKACRPELTAVIDVATRRVLGWSVALDEAASAVRDALVQAVKHGVPAIWYTDNGPGYVAAETLATLSRLGTTATNSIAYNAQARGVVERLNATLWIPLARRFATFQGDEMDREARQRAFRLTRQDASRLMPWQSFCTVVADAVATYNARPHSALGHRSPDQVWASFCQNGWEPLLLTEAELVDLGRPSARRVVNRATIALHGHTYHSLELERLDLHGREVDVRFDPIDPEQVWVFDDQGHFLTLAHRDAHARPYFPASFVQQAQERRAQGKVKRLRTKVDKALSELSPPTITAEATNVTSLALAPAELSDAEKQNQRWAEAQAIQAAMDRGEAVSDADRLWLGRLQGVAWYRARMRLELERGALRAHE
ncbi:MAG: hypothetical protein EAZ99_14580 [Alphaproteobacteria bacterium]|nr:MAG: hypothetical protein EAZ99_14580 [Alphaproteobacteria bacterium]